MAMKPDNSAHPLNADLAGRGVLVIGATTGIGAATVLAFAARGARLCFAGQGVEQGNAVAAEARRLGAETAAFMESDVRNESEIRALLGLAIARCGRIQIAINNAGVE